ncbi:hypothetical protein TNCV_1938711 [Trichonephila clavipes]|nr:hypothetical protein TNCV_1938711 [Trichonephila clavipes]
MVAFTSLSLKFFPGRLCLRYRKRWKSLGVRSGLYGEWSNTSQPKIQLSPESFEKCEALRYRGEAKHFLTACRAVCFVMLFGASVKFRSRHLR